MHVQVRSKVSQMSCGRGVGARRKLSGVARRSEGGRGRDKGRQLRTCICMLDLLELLGARFRFVKQSGVAEGEVGEEGLDPFVAEPEVVFEVLDLGMVSLVRVGKTHVRLHRLLERVDLPQERVDRVALLGERRAVHAAPAR